MSGVEGEATILGASFWTLDVDCHHLKREDLLKLPVVESFQFNHKMEIVGTSSTDQRIKDQSHEQIMDQSDEVSLDINELANSLREQLKIKKAFSPVRCIYRVPERLRKLNEKAYTPRVVSIGPIHHGKENLKAMEDHKIMYLQQFLEQNLLVSVEDLVYVIKENETALRDCYAETISLSRKDFATMILLDAVFIIMVLLNYKYMHEHYDSGRRDHIFYPPYKFSDVAYDMCLLENQLPFFILEKFLELSSVAANPENCTLTELTRGLLEVPWGDWVNEGNSQMINSSRDVLHFVDFLRKCQQPKEQRCPAKENASFGPPTATELHQSGMKFKNTKEGSLLDITFSNGILEIPQLKIEDNTEILFRNLQAFEQCHHRYMNTFVSNYITFISCLVRSPNDVEVLVRKGNLKNMLNNDEALSNLLYKLDQENVVVIDGFLSGVGEDLKSYCRKRRHKWMATLKQVYFNNPWTGISVLAATFLLILTVIQTVCSIIQLP
ncbi:PREDICTED: UPF0481 protein At3g47200-like [Populus euphratica]|uniref:UPF0481 protein At3g47200-like n=1 Tax=Populus euphratica TaxID=75702 RepID=A0AAJ6V5H1_POPEU|nr:PREDICTED: UPF0481 protein At3g47200-like [Populus euphratica]